MLGAVLVLAPACDSGDDSDDGVAEETGDGDGDVSGDGDGDKAPTTGDGDGDGDEPTTGGDFGGTGELEGCAVHEDADACVAAVECAPVYGQPLVDLGDAGWCAAAEAEFIGCTDGLDLCPNIGKTLCAGEEFWRTTGCVPDNLSVCDAPGDVTGTCT